MTDSPRATRLILRPPPPSVQPVEPPDEPVHAICGPKPINNYRETKKSSTWYQ